MMKKIKLYLMLFLRKKIFHPRNVYGLSFFLFILVLGATCLFSCKKFVEIDTPPDRITQENVFSNDRTAITVLSGIYDHMYGTGVDISKYCGLLSDELMLWSGADQDHFSYFTNSLVSNQSMNTGKDVWNSFFNHVFTCNAAIEGLTTSQNLTSTVKEQLLGEAYFLRAFFYFYLVNLYGDLPVAVKTNPEVNRLLPRSPTEVVYKLMIDDLRKAEQLLNSSYVDGQLKPYSTAIPERVRPTKWSAIALLARVYLYKGDYANAEIESSKILEQTTLFSLIGYESIFLKNSEEAIWQIQPTEAGWNTREARVFHIAAFPAGFNSDKPVYLSPFLFNAFESTDRRKASWIDSFSEGSNIFHFPTKYQVAEQNGSVVDPSSVTEYSVVLRLAEQYLIRAEARAKQNNIQGAISDLDLIRGRANIPLISETNPGISQSELLKAILNERRVELFVEWGHRWFDLKRFGAVDEVMSTVTPAKGGGWESTDKLLPIPYEDLLYGVNLVQNPGYE